MTHPLPRSSARRGTILIIVAGISALLAALALTFIARMRSDTEESQFVMQYAQAKIMLSAACNYVQESSRLGWDRYPSTTSVDGLPMHEEAFGWVDVRTGETGPLNKHLQPLTSDSSKWPAVGTHVRSPMFVMKRPPFATRLNTGYNLMQTSNSSAPDYCQPLLRYPDPQPVTSNGWSGTPASVTKTNYDEFAKGDKSPIPDTAGRSWFRVYRDGPGTFLVTCGAGASDGFKSWQEVGDEDEEMRFMGDQAYFNSVRSSEVRLHYRIIWTAASTETSYHNLQHEIGRDTEHYETWPPNSSHTWSSSRRTQTWIKNPVGTILSIQRLVTEPTFW